MYSAYAPLLKCVACNKTIASTINDYGTITFCSCGYEYRPIDKLKQAALLICKSSENYNEADNKISSIYKETVNIAKKNKSFFSKKGVKEKDIDNLWLGMIKIRADMFSFFSSQNVSTENENPEAALFLSKILDFGAKKIFKKDMNLEEKTRNHYVDEATKVIESNRLLLEKAKYNISKLLDIAKKGTTTKAEMQNIIKDILNSPKNKKSSKPKASPKKKIKEMSFNEKLDELSNRERAILKKYPKDIKKQKELIEIARSELFEGEE